MPIKVGINGFGRIGRIFMRLAVANPDIEIVGVNDLADAKTLAHLFKYDSTYGPVPQEQEVEACDNGFVVNRQFINAFSFKDPAELPWAKLGAKIILESTGKFRSRKALTKHLERGAKKVLLTVPAERPEDVDATIVMGVNDHVLTDEMTIISNASCTTNCLAPLAKVIHQNFGIEYGLMTTIHSYTNDQQLLDFTHKDLRRARSAAVNIIPTSTGAAKAIGLVIPELDGKMNGLAVRVPTVTGSVVDLVVALQKLAEITAINEAVAKAADDNMKGIIQFSNEPLVSTDIIRNPHSCVFDSLLTQKAGDHMFKLIAWYDNEWAYACRCIDLIKKMASSL